MRWAYLGRGVYGLLLFLTGYCKKNHGSLTQYDEFRESEKSNALLGTSPTEDITLNKQSIETCLTYLSRLLIIYTLYTRARRGMGQSHPIGPMKQTFFTKLLFFY
jgi:hypothetical protein